MAGNFERLVRILQIVPRAPKTVDTNQLLEILAAEGHDVSARNLQRDLEQLEALSFGVEGLRDSKPFRWRYKATAASVMMPGLDPQAALALRLVELHLERAVPKATLKALQPHLQASKKALEGKPVNKWLDKVRLVPRSQPLRAPQVDGAVVGAVHEALLEGKQLAVSYRSKKQDKVQAMTLHPLGLVHRDSVAYLVATAHHYTDARLYPLHRFVSASMTSDKASVPKGFDLDAFVAQGELGYRIGKTDVSLVLEFEKEAGLMLEETPLSDAQKVIRVDDGRVRVEATVPDTQVLRSWILGFGAKVEVLAPAELRTFVRTTVDAMRTRYA